MKRHLLLGLSLFLLTIVYSQNSSNDWKVSYKRSKSFIENKGQFDHLENKEIGKIKYVVDLGGTKVLFGTEGISYNFQEITKKSKEERRKIASQHVKTFEEHKQKERLYGKFLFRSDEVSMKWKGANENLSIVGEGLTPDYHSYSFTNKKGQIEGVNYIKGYTRLIYKNLYPNIDVEYDVHPEIGVKYAFILHPGANLSDIKMFFDRDIRLIDDEIHISTLFGDIIDHSPITFYQDDKNEIIASHYSQNSRSIAFDVGEYDITRTIVIDPWVQTPSFNLDWDLFWECEKDNNGDVYAIGGIMPLQLLKYDGTNGALQWTYSTPYDTSNCWLGGFATDNFGNSYVTRGSTSGMQKVDALGNLLWSNTGSGGSIGNSDEYWNIAFNCDQTKLITGGTAGAFWLPPILEAGVFDINTSNGNVNQTTTVAIGPSLGFPPIQVQEVRSIVAAPNGKYYFLTQDTIGYINDDFNICPNGSSLFKIDNGFDLGYKCENYSYDNTGIMALAADENFVYVNKGDELQQRSLSNLNVISSVTIPNGQLNSVILAGNQVANSGTAVDDCGNVYVGSTDGVYVFNSSLSQIGFYPTSFRVYDVTVSIGGDIIACGGNGISSDAVRSGGIQSFAAAACAPITTSCCDATICFPEDLCEFDSPISLTTATGGGTWSGPGVDVNGNFDPSVAGAGVHNITYSLVCGSETISITVDPCAIIDICEEANGDLTASGGNGSYTWYEIGSISPQTPISSEQECIDCSAATPQYAGFPPFLIYTGCDLTDCPADTVWSQYATGTTTNAPPSYPIMVVDGNGATTFIDNAGILLPCSVNPCSGVIITLNIDSQSDAGCFGGNDGAATVSSSGGASPYNYVWTPGSLTGNTQTALSAGTYNIAIQDNNGCIGSGSVTIGEPTELNASATSTPASCGGNDGSATGSATGGTGTYSYSWSPSGGTNQTATGLAAGTYTVTVTDLNMCTDDFVIDVMTTNGPTIALDNSSNVSCFGANDGSATVSASGGTTGYTYAWMPGSLTGATQTSLAPGSYTVTVTDGAGCTDQLIVDITEPSQIVLSTSNIVDANCGASDGSATVNATGGTGNYTYSWSPVGGTGATATNIPGGAYVVTVSDDSGCSEVINLTVANIGGPTVSLVTSSDVSCFGLADGSAEVSVTGGSSPYTYSWAPAGGSSATATGLIAGTYTVTVTDAGSCIGTLDITISEPSEIVISETITDENCGQNDGAIALSASGGNPTYSYLWSPGAETTSSITGLSGGNYDVTVTDASACTATGSYTVNAIGSIPVTATPQSVTISAGDQVQLNATGALTYVWSPSNDLDCSTCPDPIASPTTTTQYIVTGTDANGCTGVDTVTIFVTIECGDIYVPNIFSPNSDLNNDFLCVYGSCVSELQFAVYDRWGELLFETTSTVNLTSGNYGEVCWDGTFRGKPMNSGVYAYRIYAELFNGDIVEESGNITLVR